MAKIFISYSSKDLKFATQLRADLNALGHQVWMDEWNILVGESVPKKINEGLSECDYVAVILSRSSVASRWVETEWQSKYWDEIKEGEVKVLPLLLEKCELPKILAHKKYADFTQNYSVGIVQLTASISPIIPSKLVSKDLVMDEERTSEISTLIEKAHSTIINLSQTIAESLTYAIQHNSKDLESFCRSELKGWHDVANEKIPDHRLREVFLSPRGDINLGYFEWAGNPSAMFEYMRQNPKDFLTRKMGFPDTIAEIEKTAARYSPTGVYQITMPIKHFAKDAKDPEAPLRIYITPNNYIGLLESIRKTLVTLLLDLLPSIEKTKK